MIAEELAQNLEADDIEEKEAPVRSAHRYLQNHMDQLDYQGAANEGLPIGSGLIESGHKHLIQARLKLAGAAWRKETANSMIAARAERANEEWENY